MKVCSKAAATASFDSVAYPVDTVASVKERFAAAQAVPFSDTDLVFKGRVLGNDKLIADCGLKDGASVDFLVNASEDELADQLLEFLDARALNCDELGLVYTYKYGVSIKNALSLLGLDVTVQEFVTAQKRFNIVDGLITPTHKEFKLNVTIRSMVAPRAGSQVTELVAQGEDTIGSIKIKLSSSLTQDPAFPQLKFLADGEELEDNKTIGESIISPDATIELVQTTTKSTLTTQLEELLSTQGHESSVANLGLLYSCKYGVSADKVTRGLTGSAGCRLVDFLNAQKQQFSVRGACVSMAGDDAAANPSPPESSDPTMQHKKCMEVHDRVSSRQFRVAVSRAASSVVAILLEASFLHIHHYVIGGAVGNGTATEDAASAELTLFLEGLPEGKQSQWGPGYLASLAETLGGFSSALGVITVQTTALVFSAPGLPALVLRVSPVFENHAGALKGLAIGGSSEASLAEQRVCFMKKQPEPIKVTARLLKHWRSQQTWSSDVRTPTDDMLDLLAVHCASQLPSGQQYNQAIVLQIAKNLMESFSSAKITWPSTFYGSYTVSLDLLQQQPLLLDPVNPFVNMVASDSFDASEIISNALTSPESLI